MALFPILTDKAQLSTAAVAPTDNYDSGVLADAGNTVVRASLTGGAQYSNGLLMTPTGQVVYVDATAGLPAGAQYVNGLPLAATGELCISTDAMATYSNGLPFVGNGALAAAVSV